MPNYNKPKFLLIGGFASSLINFRGPLLKHLVKHFEVFAAAPFIDENTRQQVEEIGAVCVSTTFERTGINPLSDLKACMKFRRQVKEISPDYVLAYTIKPVVFGLRMARWKNSKRYALITGRGSGFDGPGLKGRAIKTIVSSLYRSTLKSVDGVIFQNRNDLDFFNSERILEANANSTVIEGTGVDLDHYKSDKRSKSGTSLKFLFIARLIKEKGIPELLAATKVLKAKYENFEVQLLGWIDPNPGGISREEVDQMEALGLVTYLGTTSDIRPFMEAADVFVLPSYYNEGLPRTIQEALAMKKPVITTDHPGCRETVEEGKNGWLVPVRNEVKLAEAMQFFIENPGQIEPMGEYSYQMALEKFDVHKINARIMAFMRLQ